MLAENIINIGKHIAKRNIERKKTACRFHFLIQSIHEQMPYLKQEAYQTEKLTLINFSSN